mmetsp:Transcript_5477/g.492  ORF Transcript_5477/g.492 Transcript_5477/m.492 type:complete len:110 (-) Transcript_5477:48-377(-)
MTTSNTFFFFFCFLYLFLRFRNKGLSAASTYCKSGLIKSFRRYHYCTVYNNFTHNRGFRNYFPHFYRVNFLIFIINFLYTITNMFYSFSKNTNIFIFLFSSPMVYICLS